MTRKLEGKAYEYTNMQMRIRRTMVNYEIVSEMLRRNYLDKYATDKNLSDIHESFDNYRYWIDKLIRKLCSLHINKVITIQELHIFMEDMYKIDMRFIAEVIDTSKAIELYAKNDRIIRSLIGVTFKHKRYFKVRGGTKYDTINMPDKSVDEVLFTSYIIQRLIERFSDDEWNSKIHVILTSEYEELAKESIGIAISKEYSKRIYYIDYLIWGISEKERVSLLGGSIPSGTSWVQEPLQFLYNQIQDRYTTISKVSKMKLMGEAIDLDKACTINTIIRILAISLSDTGV